jgi:para-nitrobenzyl esterase
MRFVFLGGVIIASLSFSLTSLALDFCWWDCNRIVETSYGKVKGKNHGSTNRWYAIPYGADASGNNRWKPPQPVKPWSGTRNASSSMTGCEQWASPTGVFFSDEDCLNLTVYAPDKEGSFPVMFWIFGGGFLLGSGNESSYKGDDLVKNEDVVVVTINHRLGPLGFLSHKGLTNEQGRSGNYGFLDQVAALEWVKNEIAAFGGDPDNITVFGESAGGASVCMLMASPLSRHLFQKGIVSSGPCGEWETLTQEEADEKGKQFAIAMGCEQEVPAEQLACLRKMTPKEMRKKIDASFNELFKVDGTQWKYFPNFTKDDYFIDANFEDMIANNKNLIEQGKLTPQVVIQGTVKDEGSLFEALKDHPDNSEYEPFLRNRLSYMTEEDIQWVLKSYPIEQFDNVGHAMSVIMADQSIVCPGVKTAVSLTDAGYPVYQYQFTQYSDSILRLITKFQLGENPPPLGVFHSGEIGFLFGHSAPTGRPKTDDQKFVSNKMQQYMGSLAHTANPNKVGLSHWPIYTKEDKTYLIWGEDFSTEQNLRGDFCPWWIEKDFFGDNF